MYSVIPCQLTILFTLLNPYTLLDTDKNIHRQKINNHRKTQEVSRWIRNIDRLAVKVNRQTDEISKKIYFTNFLKCTKENRNIREIVCFESELKTFECDILNPDRIINLEIKNERRTSNI